MTLDEKLERMRMTSMELARANGNKIISTHKESVDRLFEDHKETALRQAQLTIKTENNNAKQQYNKAIATYQTELKRDQRRVQSKLKKLLFTEVKSLLMEYMQTSEYIDLLVHYIQVSQEFAQGSSISIYINSTDADKLSILEDKTNAIITVSNEDFLGGVRAIIHDRNVLIDHSFLSALAEERNKFQFSGGGLND